jgi:type I restriction enzyme M protein
VKQRIREKLLTDCNVHTIVRLPQSTFHPATVATNLLFFEKGTPTKEIWYYEHRLPEGQKSYSKTKPIRFDEFKPIMKWWKKRKESEVSWKVKIADIKNNGWDLDIKNPNKPDEENQLSSIELMDKIIAKFNRGKELVDHIRSSI